MAKVLAVPVAIAMVASCSSGSDSKEAKQDSNAKLVIWTDATRLPGFQEFQKAHPDVKMQIDTVELGKVTDKLQVLIRGHQDLPDVVFTLPGDIANLTSPQYDYAQDLGGLVDDKIINDFGAALNGCRVDDKVYCLQNDLAPTVLWYNKKLMDDFGYTVPTTWDEYRDLGLKVAAEHPGYLVGSFGGLAMNTYFWPSGCPLNEIKSADTVHINTSDPACTRVADVIDPLLKAGSIAKSESVDADFIKAGTENKILMLPAGSFFGDFVFKASYKTPAGQLAVAPSPTWSGESENWSGAMGGGIYVVSKHSKNRAGAAAVATWMATDLDYQKTVASFPAYPPAAQVWGAKMSADKYYAVNPFPVLAEAALHIRPTYSYTRFDPSTAFGATVVAAVKSGKTIAGALSELQTQLEQLAQINGYKVTK